MINFMALGIFRCEEAPLPSSVHGSLDLNSVLERKCRRCHRLNIDCTFILPIGETRDRSKKLESPSVTVNWNFAQKRLLMPFLRSASDVSRDTHSPTG